MAYNYDRTAATLVEERINRSKLPKTPTYKPKKEGPVSRAEQRKELNLFNNISNVEIDRTRSGSAWVWRFNGTRATAEGAAREGFYVWKIPGESDAYWAVSNVPDQTT